MSRRARKQRYERWRFDLTPVQLIRKVWGLGRKKHCIDLTLVLDDSTLMDMDAPDVLPAGSTRREETPAAGSHQTIYWAPRETIVAREC